MTWLIEGNRFRLCGGTRERTDTFGGPHPKLIVDSMGIFGVILIELLVTGVEFL
jgi:hypothetical protein